MEIKNFDIEFVNRTKELLKQSEGQVQYDMSIIINCTLGLIILPYETSEKNPPPLWNTELEKITGLPHFELELFKPIKGNKRGKFTYYPKTLKVFLKKIRNGLSHQHIKAVNDSGKFTGIKIMNYFPNKNGTKDLEVYFSQQELKNFAFFIADEYLKNENGHNTNKN